MSKAKALITTLLRHFLSNRLPFLENLKFKLEAGYNYTEFDIGFLKSGLKEAESILRLSSQEDGYLYVAQGIIDLYLEVITLLSKKAR